MSVGVEPSLSAAGQRDWYAQDARYIRQALVGAEPLYDTVHSRVLQGKDAHRQNVIDALTWVQKQAKPSDTTVVFFSAHGDIDETLGYRIHLAQSGKQSAELWGTELRSLLNQASGKVIVLLDTCHSGAALPSKGDRKSDVCWLTACQSHQLSFGQWKDPRKPHGHFVAAACEGLRGAADDDRNGVVTFTELARFVPTRASKLERRQHGISSESVGDVIQLAKVDPAFRPTGQGDKSIPSDTAEQPNLLGDADAPDPVGADVVQFAEQVELPGDEKDPNAVQWDTTKVAATNIAGEWNGRWNGAEAMKEWETGTAKIRVTENRVVINYRDSGGEYLIEAEKLKDRLIGRYRNLDQPSGSSSPWVGRIVSPFRIDGIWREGRWDFRRTANTNRRENNK